jgi:hypothetical protein
MLRRFKSSSESDKCSLVITRSTNVSERGGRLAQGLIYQAFAELEAYRAVQVQTVQAQEMDLATGIRIVRVRPESAQLARAVWEAALAVRVQTVLQVRKEGAPCLDQCKVCYYKVDWACRYW